MSAWGTGSFQNDSVLDWADDLEQQGDLGLVEEALTVSGTQEESESAPGYIDADVASNALAAAEVVAALLGNPSTTLPERVRAWVAAHPIGVAAATRTRAITAVERVLTDSELCELWAESDDAAAWRAEVAGLLRRLRA